jgi:dolichyl-phosphate-mannose-protein mannosyltransferase
MVQRRKLHPAVPPARKHVAATFSFKSLFDGWTGLFPSRIPDPLCPDWKDVIFLVALIALGLYSRLYKISFPPYVVFDEVYFGTFTNWYLTGQYFKDIHPPLAKLMMAGVARLWGYTGHFAFESLGENQTYPTSEYIPLRITPAMFGGLVVPLTYCAMRAALCSQFASVVASVLITCDVMMVVEARHILSDGILHFFAALAIFSIFLAERAHSVTLLLFEGLCLACVAACKYTAGGIVILAFIRQFRLNGLLDWRGHVTACVRCGILGVIVGVFHILCFIVHLELLPYIPSHTLDAPPSVRMSLVDPRNPDWAARRRAPSILRRVRDILIDMHRSNMGIGHTHPYSSPWNTWVLCTGKWVLYWTREGRHILCLGNVLLWWPIFVTIIASAVRMVYMFDFNSTVTATLFGWMLSYLPLALIPREMFIYHYAIPLQFGCCNAASLIEKALSPRARGFCYCLAAGLAALGFAFWCPWAYGLETPEFHWLVWHRKWPGY